MTFKFLSFKIIFYELVITKQDKHQKEEEKIKNWLENFYKFLFVIHIIFRLWIKVYQGSWLVLGFGLTAACGFGIWLLNTFGFGLMKPGAPPGGANWVNGTPIATPMLPNGFADGVGGVIGDAATMPPPNGFAIGFTPGDGTAGAMRGGGI